MPNKFICHEACGEATSAKPCEVSFGRVEGGEFRTEESSPALCPVCAIFWITDRCLDMGEKRKIVRQLLKTVKL